MNVVEVRSLGFAAPEVAEFDVDHVPDTDKEWSAALAELDLTDVIGSAALAGTHLQPIPGTAYSMTRNPATGEGRDWWAGDHILHFDGARWDVQPVLTVIGCQYADAGAPGTEFVDTVRLLDITLKDGFWTEYGLKATDLAGLSSTFVDSTYQREARPFLELLMTDEERAVSKKIIDKDLENAGCQEGEMEKFLAKMDKQYPPKTFGLIRQTPFSNLRSLFLDAGMRNSKLEGPNDKDYTAALHALRWNYLSDGALAARGIAKKVKWTPNHCVIFPQIGTLHRALPGNAHNRSIHLDFLGNLTT